MKRVFFELAVTFSKGPETGKGEKERKGFACCGFELHKIYHLVVSVLWHWEADADSNIDTIFGFLLSLLA